MEGLSGLTSGLSLRPTAADIFMAVTAVQLTSFMTAPHGQDNCSGTEFDYIIVGAGSAGSIIATRLSEDKNVNVLLVEAGGDPPLTSILPAYFALLPHTKWDWNFTSTRSPMHQCHTDLTINMPQGKMLGGGSSFNWMCYVTGDPHDYDTWAYISGDDSWKYDNILPLIKRNEDLRDKPTVESPNGIYHGTRGPVGVTRQYNKEIDKYLESFKELGHDIVLDTNGRNTLGFSHLLLTIADGVRQSTAHAFLKPAMDRPNLCILTHTMATKILFDYDKNAEGIETINLIKGDKIAYKAKREVIISAGALNSAKLMMLSGIGPKRHLEEMGIPVIADLSVGENLQDHLPVLQGYLTDKSVIPNLPINPHEYPEPLFGGYVALNKSQSYPDYQILGSILDPIILLVLSELTTTYKQELIDKFFKDSIGRHIIYMHTTKLTPRSRGKVLLNSTDPLDKPILQLGFYSDEQDLADAVAYTRDVHRVSHTKYLKSMKAKLLKPTCCEDLDEETEEYWFCHCKCLSASYYHYCGTCSMGLVVDSKLRVYNVKKLRVADGSVMPVIPSGNTNVPIMMIGEKCADMIKAVSNEV
ncbi:ecdysone oxidase-like [Plodia interpunctella]|uniref:ecdysone oxidase-like n=1 Tax=Plodia interpunctella TaxID=58824 RepID=UPI00236747F2|nr:ecdysone oxidase-like [Plodia interpunctella]